MANHEDMTAPFRLSGPARRDLLQLGEYIGADSPIKAARVLDTIRQTFIRLATNPRIGRSRPELGAELRSFPVRSYLIVYRPTAAGVLVMRVIHGARDLRKAFQEEET